MDDFPITDGFIVDYPVTRKDVISRPPEGFDIADTYPKHLNISFEEADAYVLRQLKGQLQFMPVTTQLVRLGYDQTTFSCIKQLKHHNFGIGKSIESIIPIDDFSSYLLRFLEPIKWN